MSTSRILTILLREVRLSPRSPIVVFAVAIPLAMTFLISAVFGSLFESAPSLGIVDEGASALTGQALALEGIEVVLVDDAGELRALVEAHDLDAGIVLGSDFDAAVAAGESPDLTFLVSGESLAVNRVIVAVTTVDLVRDLGGQQPPVTVVVAPVGDEDYVPVGDRLIPTLVLYAVLIAALFVPAASLVDEREKRTIDAILVTPTKLEELLIGKAVFAVVLATLMGLVTLALNRAFGGQFWAMTAILAIGSVMMTLVGLILGLWAKDITTLYTAVKAGGFLVFVPAIFYLFPALPSWIPRLFPTYYFLQPVYDIAVLGSSARDVLPDLAVAAVICIALVPIVARVARRTERRLGMLV